MKLEWRNTDPRLTDATHIVICKRDDQNRGDIGYRSITAEVVKQRVHYDEVTTIYIDSGFHDVMTHNYSWPTHWYWVEAP
jgi:hypothetical protein